MRPAVKPMVVEEKSAPDDREAAEARTHGSRRCEIEAITGPKIAT
jgi:hypothetical protein